MKDENIVFILDGQLKEIRSDIKSIRDTLAPMQVDLKHHIMRTDLNEDRIEKIEEQLLAEAKKRNEILERGIKIFQLLAASMASLAAGALALHKMGLL